MHRYLIIVLCCILSGVAFGQCADTNSAPISVCLTCGYVGPTNNGINFAAISVSNFVIRTGQTMDDNAWIGLGAAKGRIVFDDLATDELIISNASFVVQGLGFFYDLLTLASGTDDIALNIIGDKYGGGTYTASFYCSQFGDLRIEGDYVQMKPNHLWLTDDKECRLGASLDYRFLYVSAQTRLRFQSTDVDGSGTDGVLFDIIDGTDDLLFTGGATYGDAVDIGGYLALSDTNDIPTAAAGMAKLYVTNSAAELWVIDASGNRTQLSAHDGDIPIERSGNDFTGRSYWRNKWTGEEIKSWILPRDTWAAREERENHKVEQARAAWTAHRAVFDAWQAAEPVLALGLEIYAKLYAEWQLEEVSDPGLQPAEYVKRPVPAWVTSGLAANPNIE